MCWAKTLSSISSEEFNAIKSGQQFHEFHGLGPPFARSRSWRKRSTSSLRNRRTPEVVRIAGNRPMRSKYRTPSADRSKRLLVSLTIMRVAVFDIAYGLMEPVDVQ